MSYMKATNLQSETILRDLLAGSGIPALVRLVAPVEEMATLRPWDQLAHPSDPQERLLAYLDAWASMDESLWPEANVKALYDDIMDIFCEHSEAERWYREWRAAYLEARLC